MVGKETQANKPQSKLKKRAKLSFFCEQTSKKWLNIITFGKKISWDSVIKVNK